MCRSELEKGAVEEADEVPESELMKACKVRGSVIITPTAATSCLSALRMGCCACGGHVLNFRGKDACVRP